MLRSLVKVVVSTGQGSAKSFNAICYSNYWFREIGFCMCVNETRFHTIGERIIKNNIGIFPFVRSEDWLGKRPTKIYLLCEYCTLYAVLFHTIAELVQKR